MSLYRSAGLSASANTSAPDVEPHKSFEHLTTPITSMAFHPGGELFVSASSAKKDALKLVSSMVVVFSKTLLTLSVPSPVRHRVLQLAHSHHSTWTR